MNEFRRKLYDMIGSDSFIGTFADPSKEVVGIENYTYTVDGNTLTANITQIAPQVFNLPMDTDSDFVLTYFSGFARAAGATVMIINPALMLQITDKSTGRTFFNQPAPMAMLCGQGGFPFLLTSPRIIRARSTLNISAISAQNQAFSGFYFCFHGSKIYYA